MAIKTFSTGEVLTASDTNTYLANSGLVYVASLTATYGTTSALNFNNVFTGTYTNYKIVLDRVRTSTASTIQLRLRASGTDATTLYYYAMRGLNVLGTSLDTYASNVGQIDLGCYNGAGNSYIQAAGVEIINPAVAIETNFLNMSSVGFSTYVFTRNGGGHHNAQTAYDGFSLFPSGGGTFQAVATVYGFRIA